MPSLGILRPGSGLFRPPPPPHDPVEGSHLTQPEPEFWGCSSVVRWDRAPGRLYSGAPKYNFD
jgi:hypothetical protein